MPTPATSPSAALARPTTTFTDLLEERDGITRHADIAAFVNQTASRLEVVAADSDPRIAEALTPCTADRASFQVGPRPPVQRAPQSGRSFASGLTPCLPLGSWAARGRPHRPVSPEARRFGSGTTLPRCA